MAGQALLAVVAGVVLVAPAYGIAGAVGLDRCSDFLKIC